MVKWLPAIRWRRLSAEEALALDCSVHWEWDALELVWGDSGIIFLLRPVS